MSHVSVRGEKCRRIDRRYVYARLYAVYSTQDNIYPVGDNVRAEFQGQAMS